MLPCGAADSEHKVLHMTVCCLWFGKMTDMNHNLEWTHIVNLGIPYHCICLSAQAGYDIWWFWWHTKENLLKNDIYKLRQMEWKESSKSGIQPNEWNQLYQLWLCPTSNPKPKPHPTMQRNAKHHDTLRKLFVKMPSKETDSSLQSHAPTHPPLFPCARPGMGHKGNTFSSQTFFHSKYMAYLSGVFSRLPGAG